MPSLVVIVIALILLGMSARIVREIYIARRAGMSEHTPVCANCFYRLGWWTSSICPECGSDVRLVGVRTGPRTTRGGVNSLILILAFIVVMPLTMRGAHELFPERRFHLQGRFGNELVRDFHVTLKTTGTWRRTPLTPSYDGSLYILYVFERATGAGFRNGLYVGSGNRREITLPFDTTTDWPTDEQVTDAVHEALGSDFDSETVDQITTGVCNLLLFMQEAHDSGDLDYDILSRFRDPNLQFQGSGGGGGSKGTHWIGTTLALLVTILVIVVGFKASRRYCKGGTRRPRIGEWETTQTI